MITQEQLLGLITETMFLKVGKKTTICVLTLKSGFEIVGTSACVNPADYDFEIGSSYAKEKAIDKLWELEGYLASN